MNETSVERKHPFCVISKAAWGDPAAHDVQTNSAWSANPYGEEYAVVPDDMVEGILATRGFCDIELNEDFIQDSTLLPGVDVEKKPTIGGKMAQLDKTFPTLDCAACILTPKMVDVAQNDKIRIFSYSDIDF